MKIQGIVRYAMPLFVAISLLLGGLFYWWPQRPSAVTGIFFTAFRYFFTLRFRRR